MARPPRHGALPRARHIPFPGSRGLSARATARPSLAGGAVPGCEPSRFDRLRDPGAERIRGTSGLFV